ncbi:MAG: hypothetical protein ACRDP7_47740, partial [Trebonia sp.]
STSRRGGPSIRSTTWLPGTTFRLPRPGAETSESQYPSFTESRSRGKGHGSKAAGLAMAFKLIESARRRWRMVNAPHLVALVRAGATFVNGKLAERAAQNGSLAA